MKYSSCRKNQPTHPETMQNSTCAMLADDTPKQAPARASKYSKSVRRHPQTKLLSPANRSARRCRRESRSSSAVAGWESEERRPSSFKWRLLDSVPECLLRCFYPRQIMPSHVSVMHELVSRRYGVRCCASAPQMR